jgi:hypothetical protein
MTYKVVNILPYLNLTKPTYQHCEAVTKAYNLPHTQFESGKRLQLRFQAHLQIQRNLTSTRKTLNTFANQFQYTENIMKVSKHQKKSININKKTSNTPILSSPAASYPNSRSVSLPLDDCQALAASVPLRRLSRTRAPAPQLMLCFVSKCAHPHRSADFHCAGA